MFKLVAVQEHNGDKAYAVFDESDGSFDVVSEEFIKRVSIMGLPIAGINVKDSDGNFTYSEEHFIPFSDDEGEEDSEWDEDEDDWNEDSLDEDTNDWSDEESEEFSDEYDDEDYGDDWDDGEWDDDYVEDSDVDKLYAMLTEKQGNLLKRYYLWTSQVLFNNNGVSGVKRLSAKNTKKAQDKIANIEALRGQGKTWIYAGYLDLGYRGADYCNLCGAPLRYQHYICDASVADVDQLFWGNDYNNIDIKTLNENIRKGYIFPFGIECTGDFFDIDKDDLDKIKKNQRDATDEMKFMYKLLQMPESYANAKASFRVFEEVMDAVAVSVARSKLFGQNSKFETPLLSFYTQFKEAGILYPRSLVSRLWHVFAGRDYPLRVTKVTVMYRNADLQELAKVYTYNVVKTLDTEDRKRVNQAIEDLGHSGGAYNYAQNLFMYQFMGIYSFNPYIQKNIKGVIDSPRCRDFGGANKESRALFARFTSDGNLYEMRINENYEGYPSVLNKPRVSGLTFVTGCEFSSEYFVKLLLFCYYYDYNRNHGLSSLSSLLKIPKIVDDTDRGANFKKRSDTEFMDRYMLSDYVYAAEVALNNGSRYTSRSLKSGGSAINIDANMDANKSRYSYKLYVHSIDEALELVKEDNEIIHQITASVEAKVNELVDAKVATDNEKAEAILKAEREAKEIELEKERRKAELEKQIQSGVSDNSSQAGTGVSSTSISMSSIRLDGLSNDDISEFNAAVQEVRTNNQGTMGKRNLSAKRLIAVVSVAEVNPPLKNQLLQQGSICFDILQTVRRNKGTVTPRQKYRLEQAYDWILSNFRVSDAVQNSNVIEETSSPVEVNSVESSSNPKVTEEPAVQNEDVNSEVNMQENPKEAESSMTNTSQSPEVHHDTEPKPVIFEDKKVESSGVIDITQSKELKDKFNTVVANLGKLKGMVDSRTFTSYGFALRAIKSTLKVNEKQRVVLEEMYNLISK